MPHRTSAHAPGRLLAFASAIPALLVSAWLLASLPLLLGQVFYPAAVVPLFAVAAAVLVWRAWPALVARARRWDAVPVWVVVALLAIVVAFAVVSFLTSSQHVIIRRDPGSYAVTTTWLAQHGHLEMPAPYAAFGGSPQTGPPAGIGFASQGTYYAGGQIVPQFMSGAPAVFSIGYWIAGIEGVMRANAFIGALSLLAFAGLLARLVGPRWAPLGTLALALALPQWHSSRTPLSEPLSQLLILGALVLLVDALEHGRAGFGVAGLVLGLVLMVRIDALAGLVAVAPIAAWLWSRRSRQAAWFVVGVVAGVAAGLIDGLALSLPYLGTIAVSLAIAGGLAVVVIVATIVGMRAIRAHAGRVATFRRRWPSAVAVAVVVAGALLALRPFLYTGRTHNTVGVAEILTRGQQAAGLPIEPNRTYFEQSTTWLSWWVGWAAFGLAVLAGAWLARELVRGRRRSWVPVLLVLGVASVLVLLRPSITPDHPWADRRLMPTVLPAVALLATAAVAGAAAWVRARWRVAAAAAVVVAGAAALLVPPALASAPLLTARTEHGEVALVQRVCAQLRPGDALLLVGGRTRTEWTTTLSVFCKVPTAWLRDGDRYGPVEQMQAIDDVARHVAERGRTLVLMTAETDGPPVALSIDWGPPVATLHTYQDAQAVVRPDERWPLDFKVWLARVPSSGSPSE